YNKTEKDIQHLAAIQLDILETVAPLLKKDGLLLYSTCTEDIEENETVDKHFLKKHTEFQVDQTVFDELPSNIKESPVLTKNGIQLFPQTYQTDGFFLTRLIKKSEK